MKPKRGQKGRRRQKRVRPLFTSLNQLRTFGRDETGTLLTMELILTATIVSIGAIVGLTSLRDAVSQEFGDMSAGLASLDQGYGVGAIAKADTIDNVRFDLSVAGSNYADLPNFCEPSELDPIGGEPMCMQISSVAPTDERTSP